MDEQLLKDLLATAEANQYNWELIMPKFPELADVDLQLLKDYAETAKQRDYDYEVINPLFPELFSEEPLKKKEDMESNVVDGLSVPLTTTPSNNIDTEVSAMDKGLEVEPSETSQSTISPLVKEPEFNDVVTPELMTYEEEYVVPLLKYQYEDQGFTFEESGAFGDEMKVTANNGETLNVDLDVFTNAAKVNEANSLNEFIKKNKTQKGLNQMESDYISSKQKFNEEVEIDNAIKKIGEQTVEYAKEVQGYLANKAQLDEELNAIASLSAEQRNQKSVEIKQLMERVTDLRSTKNKLIQNQSLLVNNEKNLKIAAGKYFDMLTEQGTVGGASYNAFLKGTGRIAAGATSYGIDALVATLPFAGMNPVEYRQMFVDLAKEKGLKIPENFEDMSEKELKDFFSEVSKIEDLTTKSTTGRTIKVGEKEITFGDEIETLIYDKAKKTIKFTDDVGLGKGQGLLEAIRNGAVEALGDKGVSEQYDQLMREGFWGGAWLGLMESIPAMIAPGGAVGLAARTAMMFSQVSDHYDEEMDGNPEFKDITENERAAFKLPVGIVIGALEAIGVRNALRQSPFLNKLLLRIAGKTPKNVTGKTFNDIVRNEIDNMLAKGTLVVSAAGLAEFETGALQEIADIGAKNVYNAFKEKEMFVTPDSFAEGVSQVLVAGAQEAVGGFVIGTPGAIVAAATKKDFTQVDDATFKMFEILTEQDDSSKFTYTEYKNKIADPDNKMTKDEAKAELALFEQVQGLAKQIPTDLSTEQKKKALGLMLNKKELENSKEGKDPSLTKNIDQKIQDINNQLDTIFFTKEADAVAEAIPDMEQKDDTVVVQEDITEEQKDIDSFFGEDVEETTETVESNLSINRSGEVVEKSPQNISRENRVINLAKLGAKAISKILPNTRIILHESNKEFEKYATPGDAEIIGNIIHINLSRAPEVTVPHEIFHAVFLNKIKTDPQTAAIAEVMMKTVRKTLSNDSELAQRIDKYADRYKGEQEQNEERIAELMGIMASEYKTLSKPQKNVVLKFIEDLAKALGINLNTSEFTKTDEEVINLLNTLAVKVGTGQEITESDVEVLEQGELIKEADGIIPDNIDDDGPPINLPRKRQRKSDAFQVDYGGINLNNIKRGSINDLSGTNAFVFAADKATFGKIKSPTGLEFNFYGGYLYPYGTPYGWAFTEKNAAQKVLNKIKQSDGVGLVMSQVPDGITGSFTFFQYLNAEIAHAVNKGVNPKELLKYVNQKLKLTEISSALKAKGLPGQINNLDELNTLMPFEGENKISYLSRGTFAKTFFSAESADKFGIPPITPTAKIDVGVLDYVNAPSLKQVGYGDIVSAIQFDKNSDIIEVREGDPGYHPSYPYTISGEPIMVFDNAVDVRKVYPNAVPAGPERTAARPQGVNKTPLGQREKPQAARSAMGGQYIAKIPDNIDTQGEPKIRRRQRRTLEQVTQQYNMNEEGYTPKTANLSQFSKAVAPFGYEAVRAREDRYGRGGGLFIKKPGQRRYKPPSLRRRQRRSVVDYVNEGRDAGFRDELIVDYLRRVRKLKMKDIRDVMDIPIGITMSLPESFTNIKGGAVVGLKLFKKIEAFRDRERKLNKRRKNKLSEAEIMTKAIEFLQAQPEYKNEGDTFVSKGKTKFKAGISTQQVLLENDLQKTLDQRPTQDMARRLKLARAMIRQRAKGKRDLKAIKREVRSFIRKTLPTDVYSLSEVKSLINEVTEATEQNIENVLDKVVDLATSKNNNALENKIKKLLNNEFITVRFGRKVGKTVDQSTRDRLRAIKKVLANKNATGQEIDKINESLNKEFNELLLDPEPSQDVVNKMIDIQIAININNAQKLENTNVYKTEALDSALVELVALVGQGRTLLQQELDKASKGYRDQMSKVYEAITGQKIDLEADDANEILKQQQDNRVSQREKNLVQKRIRTSITNIVSRIEQYIFGSAEALDGLMDRIDKLAGDIFGGATQVLVTDKIDASSRSYKKRMLGFEKLLRETLKEYYGKNWESKARKFRSEKFEFIKSNKNPVYYTQDQMYYLYNQYKDPQSHGAFENMFGKDYARVMKDIENKLKPEVKDFADWQVDVYFPMVYSHYNKTYQKIYRTNMPWSQFYAGRIYRENFTPEPLDLLANSTVYNTAVGSASTLLRQNSNAKIQAMNGTDALVTYTKDMEYFAAYAESVRDINKIFDNQYIKSAIREIHGDFTLTLIQDMIKNIAAKGIQDSKVAQVLNSMNTAFIFARLGLSPVIMIKQLTSIPTYASDIGIINWLKYAAKNKTEQIKVWKEVRDNSVYMQDRRNNSILRQIESYSESSRSGFLPQKGLVWAEDFLMWTTKFGDRMAIMLGGLPNYSYYKAEFKKKNPNATEQEAIDHAIIKFERDTKRTQQSSDLQDKDYTQTSAFRSFNMFMTTPKQYLRKEIRSARNLMRKLKAMDLKAGKGTFSQNAGSLLMYHVFMPMLFQYVSNGLPALLSDWDDDDTSDLVRAAVLGNLNAIIIGGEILASIADSIQGKPWADEVTSIPIFEVFNDLKAKLFDVTEAKTQEKKEKALYELAQSIATTIGVPANQVKKALNNYPKLTESEDFGEFILRLLNYSDYQISGPAKKNTKNKRKNKMTQQEMKLMFPDLYEEMQGLEDPDIKALEKELRDLEKEMLEDLYK